MAGQVTVRQLEEYWEYAETLKDGDMIEGFISTGEMPAWEEICSEMTWHKYKVGGGYFSRRHHGYCGVYRLVGLAADDDVSKPAAIDRLGGRDASGTLYVGEARWLDMRLNQLRRSFGGRESTHGASSRWCDSSVLQTRFPKRRLGVAILSTSKRMHRWIEADLMRAYLNSFGDSPPLNCSF